MVATRAARASLRVAGWDAKAENFWDKARSASDFLGLAGAGAGDVSGVGSGVRVGATCSGGTGGVSMGAGAGLRPRFLTVGCSCFASGVTVFFARGFLGVSEGAFGLGGRPRFFGGAGISAFSSLGGESDMVD